jgi:hypothetical protein
MPDGSAQEIAMHRFGANEQVEIRDLAKVELSKDTFKSSPIVYIYKNFNDCPELETIGDADSGSIRTYTLKDGEAIFYTDQNKAEFAYFTTGTEVRLTGTLTLGEFDIIELSTILDSGIQEIPWAPRVLDTGDTITFQEFQYITLGPEDTVKNMLIIDPETEISADGVEKKFLSDNWRYCSQVDYTIAGDPDTNVSIPAIATSNTPSTIFPPIFPNNPNILLPPILLYFIILLLRIIQINTSLLIYFLSFLFLYLFQL